jgi:hypothetical protein
MRMQLVILVAALIMGSGAALAQMQTPRGNDTSGAPTSSYPGAHPQSTTPNRPPAAAIPEANKPSPESIGQAPAASEKMEPGMDTAGGSKTAPGEENK